MRSLHHPGATAEDANLVQRFVDSEGGTILATFLHTFGALLFTAGIALYLYEARLVRAAKQSRGPAPLQLLPYAHGFNLLGIMMNGLGGLMRLYQSDHPRIDALATSSWVQLLFVKHLFLVLGIGLAVYLTYRTHILSLRDDAATIFWGETGRITSFAWASFGTILMASALGAVATTQLLPMMEEDEDDMQDMGGSVGRSVFVYDNDTGVITGSAAMPGRETSEVRVAEDASQILIELTWTNTQVAQLGLEVRNPDGKPVAGKRSASTGRIVFELNENILPGTWKADVVTTQAVNERYYLFARIVVGQPLNGTVLEETYTVNPKTAGANARFVEINLLMKSGQQFEYSWDVIDSDQKLDFNIHLHVDGRVDYPVRGSWNRYGGTYTHNSTQDGVSLMWENPTEAPLRVHFRIVGDFLVDSKVAR